MIDKKSPDQKPSHTTNENVLLVGFPSNGLIGTFSISYIINFLKMEQIGEMDHPELPATLFVENGEIFGPIRIYKKDNVHAILSDVPFDPYLGYDFAELILQFGKKHKIGKIVIVSGMESINKERKHPKVYGLVTHQHLEELLYNNQIPKFLAGSIFGTDAAVISVFRKSDIPALILYTECHPFFPDPEASIRAITTLSKILKIEVDTSDIKKKVEHLRIQHRNLMQETINALQQRQLQQQRQTPPSLKAPQIYK